MITIALDDESFLYDVQGLVTAFDPAGEFSFVVDVEAGSFSNKDLAVADDATRQYPFRTRHGMLRAERVLPDGICSPLEARKEQKNALKRHVYRELSERTGRTLPWGTLTGIRPVKLARRQLEGGDTPSDVVRFMKETYLCSDEKANLAVQIATKELAVLEKEGSRYNAFRTQHSVASTERVVPATRPHAPTPYSLYLGIPFCPSTCLYCSFSSAPIGAYQNAVPAYLNALKKEIDYVADEYAAPENGRYLSSIYIGGGTPTSLSAEQLDELLSYLRKRLLLQETGLQGNGNAPSLEFTVEAGRPDSITREKLEVLKANGVNRISINPQTMNDETLKLIGRHHTAGDIETAYETAREIGFDVINMDIILGLPNESLEDVRNTLQKIERMNPDNLTVHSLALKRSSNLKINFEDYRKYRMENSEKHIRLAYEFAEKMGMEPYYLYRQQQMAGNLENVGFAKPEKECLYNIEIIEELHDIVALGAGAACKKIVPNPADKIRPKTERCENVKDVTQYIARIDEMISRKRALYSK